VVIVSVRIIPAPRNCRAERVWLKRRRSARNEVNTIEFPRIDTKLRSPDWQAIIYVQTAVNSINPHAKRIVTWRAV